MSKESTSTTHWCFMPPEMHFDSPKEMKEAIALFQQSRLSKSVVECPIPGILPPKGKFECVRTSKGRRILLPTSIDYAYLFRGQGRDYPQNLPTLYRTPKSSEEIFLQRLKMTEFSMFLQQLPQIRFFEDRHYIVDYVGLAQHYGFQTDIIDLTSDIDVALFFAMCDLPEGKTEYVCKTQEKPYIGYIYCVPTFAYSMQGETLGETFIGTSISAIGLQPFERPGAQKGFSYRLNEGEGLKSLVYSFSYTKQDSEDIFRDFSQGKTLWQDDSIAKLARIINSSTQFSFNAFNACVKTYGDRKKVGAYRDYLRSHGFVLCKTPDYRLSDEANALNQVAVLDYEKDIVFRKIKEADGTIRSCSSLKNVTSQMMLQLIESGCPAPKGYSTNDGFGLENDGKTLMISSQLLESLAQTHPDAVSGKVTRWSGDWRSEIKIDLNRKKIFGMEVFSPTHPIASR